MKLNTELLQAQSAHRGSPGFINKIEATITILHSFSPGRVF